MLHFRTSHIAVAALVLLLLVWLGWSFQETDYSAFLGQSLTGAESGHSPKTSDQEDQLLSSLDLAGIHNITSGTSLQYAKVAFEVALDSSSSIPFLQDLKIALPQPKILRSVHHLNKPAGSRAGTKITIPRLPERSDASDVVFGVATDISRLDASLPAFRHWASDNGARIIALVASAATVQEIAVTANRATFFGINLTIIRSSLDYGDRYFSLTRTLYENRGQATWAAFIDDDTFFPSMTALQALLAKHNASQPLYIGNISEDLWQLSTWGIMAYGGAGIFLTMPMISQILPYYDKCMSSSDPGDRRISMCIFSHTTVRLTHESSLHQIDLRDDASGFYEALRPQPVSVHHWKSWNRYDMAAASLVSKICGDASIFQHFRFNNDWQLTNGFSIVHYTNNRGPDDIRMERTWRNSQGFDQEEMFLYSLAPLTPKDKGKIQYVLESALYDEERDEVRQYYVRRWESHRKVAIIEVAWRRSVA